MPFPRSATVAVTPPRANALAPERVPNRTDLLVRALASSVLDGSWPVGSLLPGEPELASQHAVGVAPVRAALKRLEALGLISRSRGTAARVISGEIRASYLINGGAGGYYANETNIVIDRQRMVVADAELAMLLAVREGSGWLQLTGLRMAEDASFGPLSWVDAWLDSATLAVPADWQLTPATIAAFTGAAISEIVEEFSATPLTPAQARHLRARSGTHSVHVIRRYRRANGTLAAAVRDIHPADRVSVSVRMADC
jgi:GntR family transcriptional regulator